MTIYTEEFMALRQAVSVLADLAGDGETNRFQDAVLSRAMDAITSAQDRLDAHNEKQAAYMKQRRERRSA